MSSLIKNALIFQDENDIKDPIVVIEQKYFTKQEPDSSPPFLGIYNGTHYQLLTTLFLIFSPLIGCPWVLKVCMLTKLTKRSKLFMSDQIKTWGAKQEPPLA